MKTRAAVLYGTNQPFQIEEIELDDPKEGEVLVHLVASGLCHSDWHLVTGDLPVNYPIVAGHEGAGVVEKVGPGVTAVKPGDHVILTFIPSCGRCRWCSSGLTMLCDLGAGILQGQQLDGTYRMRNKDGQGLGQMCLISTFSEWTVCPVASVVPISKDLPLDKVCLVGCGVPTGFGAAINRADVQPGETVAIFGIGGVGINAVQGAAVKGAAKVIAVDLVDFKLEMAEEMGDPHHQQQPGRSRRPHPGVDQRHRRRQDDRDDRRGPAGAHRHGIQGHAQGRANRRRRPGAGGGGPHGRPAARSGSDAEGDRR